MKDGDTDSVVLFELLPAKGGKKFGIATLNSPKSLNALSLEMVYLLSAKLREWEQDKYVAGVILRGAGDKAFCAGGDIRKLYDSVVATKDLSSDDKSNSFAYAEEFFRSEYRLDYYIRKYSKPIVCLGSGYVMGGGIGLMSGASHRIVTETSRLAMPEISIGFYPDVGGSYFLPRMPHRIGLFLSLTAAQLNAVDSVYVGLATHMIPSIMSSSSGAFLQQIATSSWSDSEAKNSEQLSQLISVIAVGGDSEGVVGNLGGGDGGERALTPPAGIDGSADWPSSEILPALKDLQGLMGNNDITVDDLTIGEIASRFASYMEREDGSEWIKKGIRNFQKGSPTSAAVCLEIWRRAQVRPLSEEEAFQSEFVLSLGFCDQHDFAEGVRALMVDKDRAPDWRPSQLEDVSAELVESHFSRFAGMQLDLNW